MSQSKLSYLCSNTSTKTALTGNLGSPDDTYGVPDKSLFVPKDEHCGIWHNPPNARCASSFGDNGTTASVSCYGRLLQLNQHLAAGRSGIFVLDEDHTDEPYFVCSRSDDLDQKSRLAGKYDFEFGICTGHLPDEPPTGPPSDSDSEKRADPEFEWLISPEDGIQDVPRVKWVNWRWPRYEYLSPDSKFEATCQWLVHKNILLRQLLFRKPDGESRDCFVGFRPFTDFAPSYFRRRRLIRDADHLDSKYFFNEIYRDGPGSRDAYTGGTGPNGCGVVLMNKLSSEEDNSDEKHQPKVDKGAQLMRTPHDSDGSTEAPRQETPLGPAVEANKTSDEVGNSPQKRTATTQHQTRKLSPSVAAVMTVFVNGEATHAYSPSRILLRERQGLEVVIAYKLIHLPHHEVDWRNFVISAQEADVSRLLREETSNLWGDSSGPDPSLFDLGLSLPDLDWLQTQAMDGPLTGSGGEETQKMDEDSNRRAPGDESRPTGLSESVQSSAQGPQIQPIPCAPEGTPTILSVSKHIRYLTWRNLEHILSVCAIPLSPPRLIGTFQEPTEMEHEAISLTCGDLPGHRVCTSASL